MLDSVLVSVITAPVSAPDVELKGERGRYLLLVQGAESGDCRARLIHSTNQINGAIALATINSDIRDKIASPSGKSVGQISQIMNLEGSCVCFTCIEKTELLNTSGLLQAPPL